MEDENGPGVYVEFRNANIIVTMLPWFNSLNTA